MSGGLHIKGEPGGLRLITLGGASLECVPSEGEPIPILGPGKPLALLVYLAASPGRTATREHLIDLLWADLELDAARHALRQTLWYLRQRLGPEAIVARNGQVALGVPLESDREAFLEAVERLDFECAVELYKGDFLPLFAAPGGADFEHWADHERYRLRSLFLRAAESLVRDWLAKGHAARAKELAARARDADPDDESAWRLLLEALLAASDRVAAELEADALERYLTEAELPPEPATRSLLARVRETPPEAEAEAPRRALVADLIGREREFSMIVSAWRVARSGEGRHVHLTGAAGLGKTRLLNDVYARLLAMGARAVQVRAKPGERQVPYALASDLAAALATLPGAAAISRGAASALVALNPSLSARYSVVADRAADLEALRHRELALAELAAAVAEEQPVALLIDDVHWADTASRQLLGSLVGKLGGQRILAVTTARPTPEGALTVGGTESLTLSPLAEEETGALLASLGALPAAAWADGLARELQAATWGSPLLILETIRLALDQGWLGLSGGAWACPDPARLSAELEHGGALRRRIEELPRTQGRLLLLLAVAGTPLRAGVLAAAAGRDVEGVVSDLWEMELRGLVIREGDERAPAHDELAALTLETAGPEALRAAHRSIGEVLARTAGDEADILYRAARHLAQAGDAARLEQAFARWLTLVRNRGDRRPLRILAAELLGSSPDATDARRLVASLPVQVRLGLGSKRQVAAAAALVATAAIVTGLLVGRATAPPDAVLLVLRRTSTGGEVNGYHVPVRREGWERRREIDLERSGEPVPGLSGLSVEASKHLVPGPLGRGWAYWRVMPDTSGREVFLRTPEGEDRRLTYLAKDDIPTGWSPDGRSIVFGAERWNPHRWQDLAVLDVETGRVRRVTSGDDVDNHGSWSPDATRIALTRIPNPSTPIEAAGPPADQLCWVTPDGSAESCFTPPAKAIPVGWYDAGQVLAAIDSAGSTSLARLDLETREMRVITDGLVGDVSVSHDGRWVAAYCLRRGQAAPAWYVFPTDRPDLAVPVVDGTGPEGSSIVSLAWERERADSTYLERLEILAPGVPLPLDASARLRARGFDLGGRPLPVPILSWRSADTTVAVIDPASGELRPQSVGSVVVYASAGGWREDSVRLEIGSPGYETVLVDDWVEGLSARWVPFGDPPPRLTAWPDGGPALQYGEGDDYRSGAYSRREFGGVRGLGVEARLSTPRSRPRAQQSAVSLYAWTNHAAVAAWDRQTGDLPPPGDMLCGFRYPATDGPGGMHSIGVRGPWSGASVQVDPRVATGEPYTVRLQIFPDGRCGIALDGRPLWRSPLSGPVDVPYRVVLSGKSTGNRVSVGRVEIWEGVRGDVEWSALHHQAREPGS